MWKTLLCRRCYRRVSPAEIGKTKGKINTVCKQCRDKDKQ